MLLLAVIAILATMLMALLRAFRGPTGYDRMLATSAFTVKTVLLIALAGYALQWHSFLDVALLYAMVSFAGNIAAMRFFERGGAERR